MTDSTSNNLTLCPYCGHLERNTFERCPSCGGFLDDLSLRVSQQHMGPWFIRSTKMPYRPGCSYDVLSKQIASGKITPTTIMRGPSTQQFWKIARKVPGIAHLLGYCHHCNANVEPTAPRCSRCKTKFKRPTERNELGLDAYDPSVFAEAAKAHTVQAAASSTQISTQETSVVDQPLSLENQSTTTPAPPQVTITSIPGQKSEISQNTFTPQSEQPSSTQSHPDLGPQTVNDTGVEWMDSAESDEIDQDGFVQPVYATLPQPRRGISPVVYLLVSINLALLIIAVIILLTQNNNDSDSINNLTGNPPSIRQPDTNSSSLKNTRTNPTNNNTNPTTTTNNNNNSSQPNNNTIPQNPNPNGETDDKKNNGSFFGIPTDDN